MIDWTEFFIKAGLWAGVILLVSWFAGMLLAWICTKFVIM